MRKTFLIKNALLFIIFFILTVGNGKYINIKFGNKVEFLGLALLLLIPLLKSKIDYKTIKDYLLIIISALVLSLGPLFNNVSNETKISLFLASLLLMSYPKFSKCFITENSQVKIIGDALICGIIINSIIGIATGTLGLSFNSSSSLSKITLACGLINKNYCGGIWLVVYISHYIFYYREKILNEHRLKLFILFFCIFLSGSKGACFLAIVFLLTLNAKTIFNIKERQGKLFFTCLIIILIFLGIYVYNKVLINIPTYAYRMRGMSKLFELMGKDFHRFIFGISDIAYANTGFDYTFNMRKYLGWDASIEMAYVNILIKYGLIGYLFYFIIFKNILNKSKKIPQNQKNIVISVLLVMLLSGFTETYIASIHYVVGPALFCLINAIVCNSGKNNEKL